MGPTLPSPGSGGGGGDPGSVAAVGAGKLERPSSLGPGKLTRRLLCYHSEHCMSHSSPPRPNNLTASASASGELPVLLHNFINTTLFAVCISLSPYRFLQVIL